MTTKGTVLITGANGKFGRHTARTFASASWTVRTFDRARDDLTTAAQGADVIVVGMHPPSYELWAAELLPLHEKVIAAAKSAGATVIVPGNVYGFGPGAGHVWDDRTPMTAENPLARLRQRMESAYREAGVRTIMLYCGDFLDDRASGNWFDRFIAKSVWKGWIAYPGALDAEHAWCYLPDAARIAVGLAERRDELPAFQGVAVPGYTLTGRELAAALGRAAGREVKAGRMAWWPLRLARPFMPVLNGVFEMRYLWSHSHRLDGARLDALLPGFEPTPPETALAAAIAPLKPAGKAPGIAVTA